MPAALPPSGPLSVATYIHTPMTTTIAKRATLASSPRAEGGRTSTHRITPSGGVMRGAR